MSSVREFTLPDLGEGLLEAEIVRWLVQVGDEIAVDQPVVEVETAKATVELPSPYGGVVRALHGEQGETRRVGDVLLEVSAAEATKDTEDNRVLVGYGTRLAAAKLRGPVPVASPVVRRMAKRLGVDITTLRGSGVDGVVTRADVLGAAPQKGERVPLRKFAVEKLTRSRAEIPHVTCWLDVDATGLVEAKNVVGIGVSALLARICVEGLRRFPLLNSTVDTERGQIAQSTEVHLGIATDSPHGLVVPVVRSADGLSTAALAAALAGVVRAAREGALAPAGLTGGTFTLNNYGVFGVDGSTPILNHPEVAMLGVGRIVERPAVHDGQLAVRKMVQLSLTFDHRVCDGRYAAEFLKFVADRVDQPLRLLTDQ